MVLGECKLLLCNKESESYDFRHCSYYSNPNSSSLSSLLLSLYNIVANITTAISNLFITFPEEVQKGVKRVKKEEYHRNHDPIHSLYLENTN